MNALVFSIALGHIFQGYSYVRGKRGGRCGEGQRTSYGVRTALCGLSLSQFKIHDVKRGGLLMKRGGILKEPGKKTAENWRPANSSRSNFWVLSP